MALIPLALALVQALVFFVEDVVLAIESGAAFFHAPFGSLDFLAPPTFLALPLFFGSVRLFFSFEFGRLTDSLHVLMGGRPDSGCLRLGVRLGALQAKLQQDPGHNEPEPGAGQAD